VSRVGIAVIAFIAGGATALIALAVCLSRDTGRDHGG
jgi:hypothetical protein